MTLVFLGYQPLRAVPKIADSTFDSLRGLPPAFLVPVGLEAVPPRRPRLFALDLEDRGSRATAIQAAASAALEGAGFYRPERRPFWPHITLARVKRGRRAEQLEAGAPPPDPFHAGDVTLYRSHLGPAGARYEPLERLRLGG